MSPKTQINIAKVCDEIKQLLLSKNHQYGDSALDPVRIFSQASPVEQLLVRIDDKLSRLSRGQISATDHETVGDTVDDLIGYLVLLKVAFENEKPKVTLGSLEYATQWDGSDIEPTFPTSRIKFGASSDPVTGLCLDG